MEIFVSARDLILTLAIAAGAYWVYTNYFQGQRGNYQEMQLEMNARDMRECIQREERIARIKGNAGLTPDGGDSEAYCAGQLGMYSEGGRWYKY
jgi:methionine synthase I (cobalamin-dependent)